MNVGDLDSESGNHLVQLDSLDVHLTVLKMVGVLELEMWMLIDGVEEVVLQGRVMMLG